jgi:hypothetical protein
LNDWLDGPNAPTDEAERLRAKAAFPLDSVIVRTISTMPSTSERVSWDCEAGDLILAASDEIDERDHELIDEATAPAPLEVRAARLAEHVRSRQRAFDFGVAVALIVL